MQGKLEALELQARIYAYTRVDVEAGTCNIVVIIAAFDIITLFDSRATHSFVLPRNSIEKEISLPNLLESFFY